MSFPTDKKSLTNWINKYATTKWTEWQAKEATAKDAVISGEHKDAKSYQTELSANVTHIMKRVHNGLSYLREHADEFTPKEKNNASKALHEINVDYLIMMLNAHLLTKDWEAFKPQKESLETATSAMKSAGHTDLCKYKMTTINNILFTKKALIYEDQADAETADSKHAATLYQKAIEYRKKTSAPDRQAINELTNSILIIHLEGLKSLLTFSETKVKLKDDARKSQLEDCISTIQSSMPEQTRGMSEAIRAQTLELNFLIALATPNYNQDRLEAIARSYYGARNTEGFEADEDIHKIARAMNKARKAKKKRALPTTRDQAEAADGKATKTQEKPVKPSPAKKVKTQVPPAHNPAAKTPTPSPIAAKPTIPRRDRKAEADQATAAAKPTIARKVKKTEAPKSKKRTEPAAVATPKPSPIQTKKRKKQRTADTASPEDSGRKSPPQPNFVGGYAVARAAASPSKPEPRPRPSPIRRPDPRYRQPPYSPAPASAPRAGAYASPTPAHGRFFVREAQSNGQHLESLRQERARLATNLGLINIGLTLKFAQIKDLPNTTAGQLAAQLLTAEFIRLNNDKAAITQSITDTDTAINALENEISQRRGGSHYYRRR